MEGDSSWGPWYGISSGCRCIFVSRGAYASGSQHCHYRVRLVGLASATAGSGRGPQRQWVLARCHHFRDFGQGLLEVGLQIIGRLTAHRNPD